MNVQVKDGNMIITVPLTPVKTAPFSSTGKNKILYSSGGFQAVGDHRVNVTVIPQKK